MCLRGRECASSYRYERDGAVVDVLAPDGINPPPTLGGGVTAGCVPGRTQALGRSEAVVIRVDDRSFQLRRPTLFGAILIKARSPMVDADPASQREGLLALLSLVEDPRELAVELRPTERRWLRQAELRLDFGAVSLISADAQCRTELVYRLLTRSSAEK
jgi:hypothetical protein